MGTLTGGDPVLDSYCRHKLPTSCRLSSIGECCACYDERGHSASYSTYIDGIGFVSRGTRWQRYCWFCKEFWENRVKASGLRPAQTRIPEVPDQTEFLDRWYEFHRGYRTVSRDDGSEERVAVLGEDFKDVSPGCLPRTLEELRAGRERSELEERERERGRQQQLVEAPVESGPTLDQTLDQLFEDAAAEDTPARPDVAPIAERPVRTTHAHTQNNSIHAQSMVAAGSRNREYQARRVAALRRELHRMRSGIERVVSGLRDLGEGVPDHSQASSQLSDLGRTLDTIAGTPSREEAERAINNVNALANNVSVSQHDRTLASIQVRVDEARQHADEARRSRDQAASELDLAEQELRQSQSRLRQVQNEQRTAENYIRLFGTREEVIAQGEDYISPIGGMFDRAIQRFRAAEEVRREERTLRQVLLDEANAGGEGAFARLIELERQERDVWGVPRLHERDGPVVEISQEQTASQRLVHSEIYQSDFGSSEEELDLEETLELVGSREHHSLLPRPGVQLQDFRHPQNAIDVEATSNTAGADIANGFAATDAAINFVRRARERREFAGRTIVGGASQALGSAANSSDERDRALDIIFVLRALSNSESLRSSSLRTYLPTGMGASEVAQLLYLIREHGLAALDEAQLQSIEQIMSQTGLVWATGLPAERNRRRRERGEQVTFTPDAFEMASAGVVIVHDVEVMAEAFQMSAQLRRQSGLNAPAQLALLYRLQRGEREEDQRIVLASMLQADATLTLARQIHEQDPNEPTPDENSRRAALESERRETARHGDHTRSELDAQRRATMGVALAAGRMAMSTGPTALLEQMASRDAETRAAYERLQQNGFVPADTMSNRRFRDLTRNPPATIESDEESDGEGRGLDAKDSGRPEVPMTDEQMTLKLDCQVCYSQLATIAMLPCGHLTMCQWCSDQHSPTMGHDRTRPRRTAGCPVCRKTIRQKVKVFRS